MDLQALRVAKIKQHFSTERVEDVEAAVAKEISKLLAKHPLPKGARVAITAGSRGISQIVLILRTIVKTVREAGYEPFLFAAMGSHGRGEAEGQRELLESLGITEESVGAPISCSAEVVQIGETTRYLPGLPVFTAKEAAEADGVIVCNRVKPHTNFRGEVESGLMKMMSVGMGRPKGATFVHRLGNQHMANAVKAIGSKVLECLPVIGGLAIVENAFEEIARIEGLFPDLLLEKEAELQTLAKRLMPSLPVKTLDVCIVQEMGKTFSGTGMDTNIIGRMRIEGVAEPAEPAIRYIGVLDLSEASHGNATGIGLADFTTERLVAKIDKQATYLNCLTSGNVIRAAIPLTLPDDRTLLETVMQALKPDKLENVRMAVIRNTLHIDELWVSEAVLQELSGNSAIEVLEPPAPLSFDDQRRLRLN